MIFNFVKCSSRFLFVTDGKIKIIEVFFQIETQKGATTFSITTFNISTLGIRIKNTTLWLTTLRV